MERCLERHMKANLLACFTQLQLRANEENQKAKAVSAMLRENDLYSEQNGVENIRRNHHRLKQLLFARVSKTSCQESD